MAAAWFDWYGFSGVINGESCGATINKIKKSLARWLTCCAALAAVGVARVKEHHR